VVGALVVIGLAACGGGDGLDSGAPEGAGARVANAPAVDLGDHAWVIDGQVVAVRQAAAHIGGYGAHGVDYAPATSACASRDAARHP
jgi:hypothetical protein